MSPRLIPTENGFSIQKGGVAQNQGQNSSGNINVGGSHVLASQVSQEEAKSRREGNRDAHLPAQIALGSFHPSKESQSPSGNGNNFKKSPIHLNGNPNSHSRPEFALKLKENQVGSSVQAGNSGYYFGQVNPNQGAQGSSKGISNGNSAHSGNSSGSNNTSDGHGHGFNSSKEATRNGGVSHQSGANAGPSSQRKVPMGVSNLGSSKQEQIGSETKSPRGIQSNLLSSNLLSRISSNGKQIDPKKREMMLEQFNASKGSKLLPFAPKNTGLGSSKGLAQGKNEGTMGYFSKHSQKS